MHALWSEATLSTLFLLVKIAGTRWMRMARRFANLGGAESAGRCPAVHVSQLT